MPESDETFEQRLYRRILALPAAEPLDHGPLQPASELSPEECVAELWKRSLIWEYGQYREYFDKWWGSLSKSMQDTLAALSEEFRDYDGWLQLAVPSGPLTLVDDQLVPASKAKYMRFAQSLPAVTRSEFDKASRNHECAAELSRRYDKAQNHIAQTFGLAKHRPIENADRDRMFSKWRYWGLSEKQIEQRCKKDYHGQSVYGEGTIRKAIKAHRKNTGTLRWALRISIYIFDAPPLVNQSRPWQWWWDCVRSGVIAPSFSTNRK